MHTHMKNLCTHKHFPYHLLPLDRHCRQKSMQVFTVHDDHNGWRWWHRGLRVYRVRNRLTLRAPPWSQQPRPSLVQYQVQCTYKSSYLVICVLDIWRILALVRLSFEVWKVLETEIVESHERATKLPDVFLLRVTWRAIADACVPNSWTWSKFLDIL